jgi:hypothetical protein
MQTPFKRCLMYIAFCIFVVICTVFYFYALLRSPALFDAMFSVTDVWKITLVGLYRFGAAVGICAMMFLGIKEVAYFVTSHRLPSTYDDYIGLTVVGIAILVMRRFERAGKVLAREAA